MSANDTVFAWHFTGKALRNGRPLPAVGEWLEHDGPIVWCKSGLYASRRIIDALSYATGHFISRVECAQIEREDCDKFVCRRRRSVARINGERLLKEFARRQALSVAHLWNTSDFVQKYLESGKKTIRDVRRARARAAARAAARASEWDEAWDAARATVWDVAWAAAQDLAQVAATSDLASSSALSAADAMLGEMVMAEMGEQS